ncbi:MFS transporter [Stakelama marina]|uniref:MFS transporter n=1 Tax=Stakelama marina TaxID=2826939 RepID=A0A8T4IG70_9SPHN|nr:MFS transporter [Stakelama marina]MBR0553597.1 MFS transporter [Stakelama marina]
MPAPPASPSGQDAASPATGERRSTAFLLVYGLAYAGGVIAYMPLLSLFLPIKVEEIAGDARLGLFTACIVAGSIASSASNILFGWLSDRSVARGGGRRRWVTGGMVALALSYAFVAAAASPLAIILAIIFFQTAVNAALAPLIAIMADEVPDAQKGTVGGLLSLGYPTAALLSASLVGADFLTEPMRLAIVMAAILACLAPLLAIPARRVADETPRPAIHAMLRRDLMIAWAARILVQIAGAVLSLYLLYYFESFFDTPPPRIAAWVGHLFTLAYLVPVPAAILIGRLSDRIDRRKPFLFAAAAVAALGLVGMAIANDWMQGAVAFGLYAVGSATFLALHSAFAMQLLPDPQHRGRDLGLLNLTNTLPSLLGPLLTWLLATPRDFGAAMLALAALALCGGVTILAVRGRR